MNLKTMQRELAVHQNFIDCLNAAIEWHNQRIVALRAAIQEAERDRLIMTPEGPVVAPELPADKQQPIHYDEMTAVVCVGTTRTTRGELSD